MEVITQTCAFVKIRHIYFKRVKFSTDILCLHKVVFWFLFLKNRNQVEFIFVLPAANAVSTWHVVGAQKSLAEQ